jgi:hypothetical protein
MFFIRDADDRPDLEPTGGAASPALNGDQYRDHQVSG